MEGRARRRRAEKIRELENKTSNLSEDNQDTLWLVKWICLPNLECIRELILREAHDSTYSIQPGRAKNIPRSKDQLFVVWHEVRRRRICCTMRHLPE
jgi:hypothetical protein